MDYSPGARYCHFCGGARESLNSSAPVSAQPDTRIEPELARLYRRLGLTLPSLICLIAALVFGLAAVLTGLIYKEDTLMDWQAVQVWRIEWLLGAVVALLTGILLKKSSSRN